jgi:hypothetical protein
MVENRIQLSGLTDMKPVSEKGEFGSFLRTWDHAILGSTTAYFIAQCDRPTATHELEEMRKENVMNDITA